MCCQGPPDAKLAKLMTLSFKKHSACKPSHLCDNFKEYFEALAASNRSTANRLLHPAAAGCRSPAAVTGRTQTGKHAGKQSS